MQDSSVDHDAIVVKVSHKSRHLEVKDLQGTVLAAREEPLVVFLEAERSDVRSVTFERNLTARLQVWYTSRRKLVDDHFTIARNS
jgi:hypothetical protein